MLEKRLTPDDKAVDGTLMMEMVASRVKEESTARRMGLVERERERSNKSLVEVQVRKGGAPGAGWDRAG